MATITTPYTSAMKLINTADVPNWMNEYDAQRLSAYLLYENIYWTNPQTFKLQQRGVEENPVYIPSGRTIVNTMDRYVGVDWMPIMDASYGTPEEQANALLLVRELFKRERMGSQFQSNKLYGIMRGDWMFYITGNPLKPQGSRLKIKAIDPGMVFPIEDENDVDIILGYDLVEQVRVGEDLRIKRTRYLKSQHPEHPSGTEMPGGPISFQVDALEVENWETEPKAVKSDFAIPVALLPAAITNLPIYHIKNFEEPQNPFGASEMRGIERIMAAVNQAITDEELALALHGLGMYKSGQGQPRDPISGAVVPWQLGPGKVVHDATFDRVNGVSSVTPSQQHLEYLHSQMDQVSGISDVAKGVVDVTVAESGVALALRMGPILGSSKKKDTIVKEVMDQFLYDLRSWFKGYEGVDIVNVQMESRFGEKLPKDNQRRFDELMQMYSADPPLITAAYFRDACREMGIDIPIEVNGAAIAQERAQMAQVMDPYGARAEAEMQTADDQADAADAASE